MSGARGLDLRVNALVVIPAAELTVDQAASSGPGGQNINKTASKIVLRFSVLNSLALWRQEARHPPWRCRPRTATASWSGSLRA